MFHYSIRIETNNLAIILIIKIMKKNLQSALLLIFYTLLMFIGMLDLSVIRAIVIEWENPFPRLAVIRSANQAFDRSRINTEISVLYIGFGAL